MGVNFTNPESFPLFAELRELALSLRRMLAVSEFSDAWAIHGAWICRTVMLLSVVLVVPLLGRMLHIGHLRRQMRRYADFLRDLYAGRPVDPLLHRKWCETVEAYNRSRRRWPFRVLFGAADADRFLRREGPPRVAGLTETGVSGDMGKRKPYRKNKKR